MPVARHIRSRIERCSQRPLVLVERRPVVFFRVLLRWRCGFGDDTPRSAQAHRRNSAEIVLDKPQRNVFESFLLDRVEVVRIQQSLW